MKTPAKRMRLPGAWTPNWEAPCTTINVRSDSEPASDNLGATRGGAHLMNIIRNGQRRDFVIASNAAARDRRLSFRARGLLVYLLSLPDGWRESSESLAGKGKEGRDAIRSALGELQAAGYLARVRHQIEGGRWATELIVSDDPEDLTGLSVQLSLQVGPMTDFQASVNANAQVAPTTDFQAPGLPTTGKPTVGKPGDTKKTREEDQQLDPVVSRSTEVARAQARSAAERAQDVDPFVWASLVEVAREQLGVAPAQLIRARALALWEDSDTPTINALASAAPGGGQCD